MLKVELGRRALSGSSTPDMFESSNPRLIEEGIKTNEKIGNSSKRASENGFMLDASVADHDSCFYL